MEKIMTSKRPNIDFHAAEEIAAAVAKSYMDNVIITIRLFDREEQGIVEKFDQPGRRIKIAGVWIKIEDIIGLK